MRSFCHMLAASSVFSIGLAVHSLAWADDVIRPLPPVDAESDEVFVDPLEDPDVAADEEYYEEFWYGDPRHYWYRGGWKGSFEVGVNGSEGNTETTNVIVGFFAKRATVRGEFSTDLDYSYEQNNGAKSADKLFWMNRYEGKLANGVTSWFFDFSYEYDDFKAYDFRLASHLGLSQPLHETDYSKLVGRVGFGASREFGVADADWIPEMVLGWDYGLQVTDASKLTFAGDYYPDVNDFSTYRINMKLTYEIKLEGHGCSLLASVFDRLDTQANPGQKKNDVDYMLSLKWEL
jgi:hypothetical protein